ncbi:synapse-associated protein of 47 kDa isoform X2 [Onthophagus taurus]|uniref:synapse-associated protein of 47 kDa isoform X2 n=1 Tax=Onthophagus taurus TaxID=166361 RepID=UPI000C207664|nr:synapse-associated protein of 47 kDa isoform X2 [Onthophagus taurus]
MFSGLTNQVSSWMGKADAEEKVPTPTGEVATTPEKKDTSPTKHSKLDMLSNVKSQIGGIGGWLGSSIPKLRKNEDGDHQEEQPLGEDAGPPATADGPKGPSQTKERGGDDDDNSSATGGADSGPQSAAESPTEEKEGQFGNAVQSKAIAGAKSFGSFIYSAVNKAGKTVSEASAKIKKTVEENSILGEFNKEQEAFMKSQSGNASSSALPPWAGCPNELALKEECLTLSTDRRNFVRSPPAGVDFTFDYEVSYPIAMAIMEQDPNLEKMRYDLVPKNISEENFWRNYFYRVTLLCQANDASHMSRDVDSQLTSDQPLDKDVKEIEPHEFVSDSLKVTSQDIVEVQEQMRKLTMNSKATEEEWEKELEAELQDYEMVSEQKPSTKGEAWDRDIQELLEDEQLK